MTALLAVAGAMFAALGVIGILQRGAVLDAIETASPGRRWATAIGVRLIFGLLAVAAAGRTLHPSIVFAFGWFLLAAAVALLLMGPRRLDALVDWALRLPAAATAVGFAGAVLVGAFLVYTSLW